MKAFDIFEKLIGMAYSYCMRYPSVRHTPDKYQGMPGELVTRLSDEDRSILNDLKSNDLATITKERAELAAYCAPQNESQYNDSFLKDEKQKFDKKILKK